MASKRPSSGFNFKYPQNKFAKLNITTSKSQALAGPSSTSNGPSNCIQNEWDDWNDEGNDELILLASQRAEQVNDMHQGICLIDEGADTFSQFKPNAASSSTQMDKDVLNDFLQSNDDDDQMFSQLPIFETNSKAANTNIIIPKSVKPTTSAQSKSPFTSVHAQNNHVQIQKNVDNKNDVRINFMGRELELKKKFNDDLQEKLCKINERLQTKEGEISMLRFDVQSLRKQCEEARREKFQNIERIKSENLAKITKLERLLKMQTTELEFKVCMDSNDRTIQSCFFYKKFIVTEYRNEDDEIKKIDDRVSTNFQRDD